ncbi:carbohydrate kinase [Kaistia dalseonensis]|uniref:Fructokinase n=1 Tax=Kaistia dalseonensis TaxID=410840 RepID=A0ABU0H377_9HYPH|nr:carbohydrate kinase [Kaistia dalseonensis]MCX5494161.1 carbohydrate kinase [Kaistia dalseonensis]MDQ0436740.1 fructokinase [Kaistia dalseonensis]
MIVSCGEALIDFLPVKDVDGRDSYHPKVGGSPYNVAMTIGRLDIAAGFLGGISTDFFGEALAEELVRSKVSLKYAGRSNRPSTLAFVSLVHDEPQYAFFDENSAGRLHDPAAHAPIGDEVEALHFGSISLIPEPSVSRLAAVMDQNRGKRVICYDPNVRPTLITDREVFCKQVERFAHGADIVKISGADLDWLHPGEAPETIAAGWLAGGTGLVVVTRGGAGVTAYTRTGSVFSPVVPVKIADTVGAGDSFTGGFLSRLSEKGLLRIDTIRGIDHAALKDALDFANRVAAITCSRPGADPPWRKELA